MRRSDREIKDFDEIIKVINNYSSALSLLDDYDHKRITKPMGTKMINKLPMKIV